MLDSLGIWMVYLLTVLFTLAAIELGYWLGKLWQRRAPEEKDSSVGALTGAALGLLAFVLAFVTSVALGRFDNRRQLVVREANAIGTTHLRAGYLDEPHRQEVRNLLREYVDIRLSAAEGADLRQVVARSEEIQAELWSHAESLARAQPASPMVALFIASLNETIDVHTVRYVAATSSQLPTALWIGLYAMTFLAMLLVGVQASYGPRQHILALVVLALVFSAVVLLVVDLNRSQEGALNVSQQAMLDLQRQLHGMAP